MTRALTVFATGKCNLKCPYCTHAPRRRMLGHYEMSLDELRRLLARVQASGAVLGELLLSGGEPAMWSHLVTGLKMIRASGIARRITIFTNGMHVDALTAAAPLVDWLRIAHYGKINARQIDTLRGRFPEKVQVNLAKHRRPPLAPLDGVLPAACQCQYQAFALERFYVCGNAMVNCMRIGLDPSRTEFSCSIEEDFLAHFDQRAGSRFSMPICAICLANRYVRDQMAGTEWQGEHPQWTPDGTPVP